MVKSLIISFVIALLPYGLSTASEMPASVRDYQTANKLFTSGRFREALSLYQRLLVSRPEHVSVSDIHARIADTYFRLGSFKAARDAYRIALKDQKESQRPETQYWVGFCCFLLGKDAEAVEEFLKVPELYPGSGMWVGTSYYWAGRASERMGKAEKAAFYYRKAAGNGRSTQGRFAMKKAEAVKEESQSQHPKSPISPNEQTAGSQGFDH